MRARTGWTIAGGLLALAGGALIAGRRWFMPATPPLPDAAAKRATDFDLVGIDGKPLPMKRFAGQVVLLVNTASMCGYTPQYEGLQALQAEYAERGFTVIGVPSGNFLGQEYGSGEEIASFCQTKFGIGFPLTEKSDVVGRAALPIYRWAAAVLGAKNRPTWNFHKYLIGRDGQLIAAFGTGTTPDDAAITSAIESALSPAPAPVAA